MSADPTTETELAFWRRKALERSKSWAATQEKLDIACRLLADVTEEDVEDCHLLVDREYEKRLRR